MRGLESLETLERKGERAKYPSNGQRPLENIMQHI